MSLSLSRIKISHHRPLFCANLDISDSGDNGDHFPFAHHPPTADPIHAFRYVWH